MTTRKSGEPGKTGGKTPVYFENFKLKIMNHLNFIFQSFWHFVGFAFLFYISLHYGANLLFKIINRLIRMINVISRGWPPSHLDADGDWKPINEQL